MAKTIKSAPAPTLSLDELDSQYARLTLHHPSTFQKMDDYWMDVAGIHSQEFEDAKVSMLLKHRAESASKEKTEEERLREENLRFRQAIGHLIVGWNEVVFGPYSREKAVEYMTAPKKLWMFAQVESFVTRQEHFFKA